MSAINAEMAATVWKITVEVGAEVAVGEEVAILESMKMEIPLSSPFEGMVVAVHVEEGALVSPGDPIMDIAPVTSRPDPPATRG